jgi:hypothetical protein
VVIIGEELCEALIGIMAVHESQKEEEAHSSHHLATHLIQLSTVCLLSCSEAFIIVLSTFLLRVVMKGRVHVDYQL